MSDVSNSFPYLSDDKAAPPIPGLTNVSDELVKEGWYWRCGKESRNDTERDNVDI